jgi:hypothetical protein
MAGPGAAVGPGWAGTVNAKFPASMRAQLLDLRATMIRMPWANNQAEWDTMRWAHANGIDVLVHADPNAPPERFVQQVAAVGVPVYIEGVNEPDLIGRPHRPESQPITPEQLAMTSDYQRRMYAAVQGRWQVLSPAVAYKENEDEMLALPHDIANFHRYNSQLQPPTPADAVLPARSEPVWITETGWPTYTAGWFASRWVVSEAQQRDYLLSMFSMLRGNGADRMVVYKLTDDGTRAVWQSRPNKNWGLFTYEGRAKLAVAALRGQ